jgi:hypothetical protein
MHRILRAAGIAVLLSSYACSGAISCSACGGGPLAPIPGGFDPAAQIERAAQIRVTQGGLDFIGNEFQNLASAYIAAQCGGPTDPPCPTDFTTGPSSCIGGECVEQASGMPGPLIGFELDRTSQSGATICRDDVNDPNRRRCYAFLRFEDLQLRPIAPDQLEATLTVQIYSTPIPFRYDNLGMDCLVTIDSNGDGTPLQDIVATAVITEWTAPAGVGGRQLDIEVTAVQADIPDDDVLIERDPVHGGFDDFATCGIANTGTVKSFLIPQLTDSLADIVGEQIDMVMGWRCNQPNTEPCPAQTTCNSDDICEENATGELVPAKLGVEGRLDLGQLLAGFSPGRPGQGDIDFLIGGRSTVDASGITVGALGGAEVVTRDLMCSQDLPSPRLRPGFVAPPPLPNQDLVDLDFDGVPETDYMLAAGISEALLDQYLWTIYSSGLFCISVSAYDIDLLNTGTLSLLMPSLAKLTHNDKYRWAIYPARLSMFPNAEPQISFGSGQVSGDPMMPVLDDPLIDITFDDLRLAFFAMVEERWVQLMVLQLDMTLGLGVIITPNNEVQLVIGDLENAISDVRVTEHELLAEDTASLEDAVPALIQFAFGNLTGVLPTIPLPSAMELGGFELDVLGVRGVEDNGTYPNIAVYANLGFDPTQVPNLSLAAETEALLSELRMPAAEDMAVDRGAERPEVVIDLAANVPAGEAAEFQYRIDGSLWTPFFESEQLTLSRAELAVQGRHRVEVRARVKGEYRTLDPTPAVVEVLIDPVAPELFARLADDGVKVEAFDVVGPVRIELGVDGVFHEVTPVEGFVAGSFAPEQVVAVAAIDAAGNRTEVTLSAGAAPESAEPIERGCVCVEPSGRSFAWVLALVALVRLRRRRSN